MFLVTIEITRHSPLGNSKKNLLPAALSNLTRPRAALHIIIIIIIIIIEVVHCVHDRQKRQANKNKNTKIPQKHSLSSTVSS